MLQPKRKENELGCSINLVPRAFPLKNGWGGPHPFFKGKALGTRLLQYFKVQMNFFNVFQSPSVLRNPDFGIWKIFLVESGNLGTGMRNTAQGIDAESHQRLESSN